MAQSIYPLSTPVDVTPGTKGSWQDVDCSSYIASGATGVVLHIHTTNTGDCAVRKKGSTDELMGTGIYGARHIWVAIGVDANRVFEAYVGTTVTVLLVGYTMSGVTFFTNAVAKSPGSASTWLDLDCSTEAPSATGLIFTHEGSSTGAYLGLRKNGSSDARTQAGSRHETYGMIIGCDDSQICEGYISNLSASSFYLVGFVTDGATFNTNGTDMSLGTTGDWYDLNSLPDNSVMGFIEVDSFWESVGLRENGSSENIYRDAPHIWAFVKCDDSYLVEGQIESTNIDFYCIGVAYEEEGVTEKSSGDSGSGDDVRTSGNPVVVLSKSETGSGADSKGSGEPLATLTESETGSGAEALSSLLAEILGDEVGSGIEAKAYYPGGEMTGSEAGEGSDTAALMALIAPPGDSGTGVEESYLDITGYSSKVGSDSGTGTEAGSVVVAQMSSAETGSGVEAVRGRALVLAEAGSGAEYGQPVVVWTAFDAGAGAETSVLIPVFFSSDAGLGSELIMILKDIRGGDGGSGFDALKAMVGTAGAGSDMRLHGRSGQGKKPSRRVRMPFKGVNL